MKETAMRYWISIFLVLITVNSKAGEMQSISWNIVDTIKADSVRFDALNRLLSINNPSDLIERDLTICLIVGDMGAVSDKLVLLTLDLRRLISDFIDRKKLDTYAEKINQNKHSMYSFCSKFYPGQYRNDAYLLKQIEKNKVDWMYIFEISKKYTN